MARESIVYLAIFLSMIEILQGTDTRVVKHATHHESSIRIVHGKEVSPPHSAPFTVALLRDPSKQVCGGSLISQNFILTAAQCLYDEQTKQVLDNITVYLGVFDWTQPKEEGRISSTIDNQNFIIHPTYSYHKYDRDIALLKLPLKVEMTDYIQSINLPSSSAQLKPSYNISTYGWGITDQTSANKLHYTQFQLRTEINASIFYEIVADSPGTCKGDSGGPIITDGIQIAVFSSLIGYNTLTHCEDVVDIFVSIFYYLQWIKNNTDIMS